ncbi:hypothetical protein [uncultured Winogradskyella sp.]|uniref:hypothetical protein n=1 Tax=uncultured Winogradskyella sp. TaxID=395353 RepID=UPI0026052305|nr:hypothetical protein [uncultured Winogradskyella sp.]
MSVQANAVREDIISYLSFLKQYNLEPSESSLDTYYIGRTPKHLYRTVIIIYCFRYVKRVFAVQKIRLFDVKECIIEAKQKIKLFADINKRKQEWDTIYSVI